MEDLTLALITLTSFVLLFVVAIFADRAGAEPAEDATTGEPVRVSANESVAAQPAAAAPARSAGLNLGRADVA